MARVENEVLMESNKGKAVPCELYAKGGCPVLTGKSVTTSVEESGITCPIKGGVSLLADDERAALELNEVVLNRMGIRTFKAENGYEAMTLFERHRDILELALVDINMPGMDGFELCRKIRAERPGFPVVFVSGYEQGDLRDRLDEVSATEFVSKPYLTKDLRMAVGRAFCSMTVQETPCLQ